MTLKSRTALLTEANDNLPDNVLQEISPADVRNLNKNIIDSFISKLGETGIQALLKYSNTFSVVDDKDLTHKKYVDDLSATNWALAGNTLTSAGIIGGIVGNYDITIKRNNISQILFDSAAVNIKKDTIITGSGNTNATKALSILDSTLAEIAYIRNDGNIYSGRIVDTLTGYDIAGVQFARYDNGTGTVSIGNGAASVTAGNFNFYFGYNAGNAVVSGSGHAIVGARAAEVMTTASETTAMGGLSAQYLTTGSGNCFFGKESGVPSGSGAIAQSIGVGYCATVRANNQLTMGSTFGPVNEVFFGNGQGWVGALPLAGNPVYIHAMGDVTNSSDNPNSTSQLVLRGARAVGDGAASGVKIQYSPKVGSGTTLQTWVDAFILDGNTGVITSVQSTGENILLAGTYQSKSANYTALVTDSHIVCTGGNTITLYTAVGYKGREIRFKNTGGGVLTLDGSGAETIDGSLTKNLAPNASTLLVSNGTNWISF